MRDLAFDGRNLVMIGEDGETYRYTAKGWLKLVLSGKSGLTAFNQKSSKFFGNVVCDWPARKNTFIFTDTKHKRGIIGGRRANPGHAPVNVGKKPGGTEAVWVIERLDRRQCLYRLRSFVTGQYLIAGDAFNGGLYIQPHQNRTNALWRIVSGLNGTVSLVDYKHGRAITAGDKFDGKLYHQELTPVSLKSKIRGRKNQWWDMKSVGVEQYQPQKAAQNKPKCDFPRNGLFRLDDAKHKRSLRWRDGNHGAGHLQDAAAWYLKKTSKPCSYWLVSKDNRTIFIAGDGYDGRIHAKPNTAAWRNRDNAKWRFQGVGKDVFTISDFKHRRQIVAGDKYNGKIYHQHAKNRANAKWRVLRIHPSTSEKHIRVYGNGRANSIGVQPMRISADPYFKRWWLTGTNNSVLYQNRTDGWKGFRHEALDVHVNDEGKPYYLSPSLKLSRPTTGDARKGNWGGYQVIASNAMRFDVDPLGYPIVIRHSGNNQISQTFPKRDSSVPGAGSCKAGNPWAFLSDYAKGRFNKMTSSVAGLANGVASGDFDKIVANMATVAAYRTGGFFSQESFLGAVMQKIPVKEMQSIGKTVASLRETGYRGWGQAILGDGKKFVKMSKDVGSEILKGSFKGVAVAFYDNHPIKDYLLGPIVETDWSEDPMLVATKIRARYTLRTLKLKGEVLKYTPAGAAKYMAKAALKDAFKKHAQGYMLEALGKKRPVSPAEKRTINKVLAMVLQGLEAEFEAAENGLQTLSPLYTEAKLQDARALLVWNDKGSGADSDGSFWRSELSSGCISLGDMGQSGHGAPKMKQICNAAKGRGKWWDYPVDYELIWSDRCSGADSDGSVWLPRCKPGYVAIGFVANNTSNLAPWRDRVACLKAGPGMGTYRPLSKSQVKYTWNDKGSGAKQNIEVLARKFGGYPMMYAWPERRGLKQTQQTYHWSAIALIGNKAAAERAFGVTKSKGKVKEYLND